MTGCYYHSIDAQGRLFIPAMLRSAFPKGIAYCWILENHRRVINITGDDNVLNMSDEERSELLCGIITLHFDEESLCLTDEMASLLGEDDVVMVGLSNRVERWPRSVWEKRLGEPATEEMLKMMRDLGMC